MRFMMLVIPKGYEKAPPGTVPDDPRLVARMMEYNESLRKAGVLVALDGLHPPSMGARVSFPGGKATVHDGPFTEAKEVVGGYWIIDVDSLQDAIAWASRCPMCDDELIEIRRVMELSDFPADVQEVARAYPDMQEHHRALPRT
ncbi:MAG: YciI family protein [Acidobacteria bacterium]|nr:YciI family protein [Acidobacteriota bacterium]